MSLSSLVFGVQSFLELYLDALGLSCGNQDPSCGRGFFYCCCGTLGFSLVLACKLSSWHGLSCPAACGTLVL